MTQIGKEKTARTFGELKSIIADIPDSAEIGSWSLNKSISLTKWALDKKEDELSYEEEIETAKEENRKPNFIRYSIFVAEENGF